MQMQLSASRSCCCLLSDSILTYLFLGMPTEILKTGPAEFSACIFAETDLIQVSAPVYVEILVQYVQYVQYIQYKDLEI